MDDLRRQTAREHGSIVAVVYARLIQALAYPPQVFPAAGIGHKDISGVLPLAALVRPAHRTPTF